MSELPLELLAAFEEICLTDCSILFTDLQFLDELSLLRSKVCESSTGRLTGRSTEGMNQLWITKSIIKISEKRPL